MTGGLFEESCYKKAIRNRLRALRRDHPRYTLKRLSEFIPIQYTYLSRVLNDESTHLNPDHLYAAAQFLKCYPEETEFLSLLHERATARHPDRIGYLDARIQKIQKAKRLKASLSDGSQVPEEVAYLLDPVAVVVHVSLHIPALAEQPHRIGALLGVSQERIRETLRKLVRLSFIEMDGSRVTAVHRGHIHYTTDHPFMRAHQEVMRTLGRGRQLQLPDSDKRSFMVTFSAEPRVYEEIRSAFDGLIQKLEGLALEASNRHTYQLNFELFRWL